MTTRKDLETAFIGTVQRTDSPFSDFLKKTQIEINRKLRISDMIQKRSQTATVSSKIQPLPTNFLQAVRLTYRTSGALLPTYKIEGTNFVFDEVIPKDTIYDIDYYHTLSPLLIDSSVLSFGDKLYTLYSEGLLKYFYKWDKDEQGQASAQYSFNEELKSLESMDNMSSLSSANLLKDGGW